MNCSPISLAVSSTVVADLNRDGRPDLIAVDERGDELAWFENPTWERHVIVRNAPRTINLDVYKASIETDLGTI